MFIDSNKKSILKVGYKIDDQQHIWFSNIILNDKKQQAIDKGYGNFISGDWSYLYQFNAQKETNKRIKDVQKIKVIEYVTFAKINDKFKANGYHFIGVFKYDTNVDSEFKTLVFKKIKSEFNFTW